MSSLLFVFQFYTRSGAVSRFNVRISRFFALRNFLVASDSYDSLPFVALQVHRLHNVTVHFADVALPASVYIPFGTHIGIPSSLFKVDYRVLFLFVACAYGFVRAGNSAVLPRHDMYRKRDG